MWLKYKSHKLTMLLLKRRFNLRLLFERWTGIYNSRNKIKYIQYLDHRRLINHFCYINYCNIIIIIIRILSLIIQNWKKFTLIQIREKIAIHYVRRLERKRLTFLCLQRWVRHHDTVKITKRELYVSSRTQHHLLRKQFKIWSLVMLQRKIQNFKILNKCYNGWTRYISLKYRKRRVILSATRHYELVRYFRCYFTWSNAVKSNKLDIRNTKIARNYLVTNNLRDAMGVLRCKAKRSTRLKVIKRIGLYDSTGLQLGIRVYTRSNINSGNTSLMHSTIDNWININKMHDAILAWKLLPRRNKRRKQRKILLAWRKEQ